MAGRGVCDTQFIIDQNLQALIRHLRLTNYGGSLRPDLELLVATRADALLVSSLVDVDRPELRKTGIPIIECADYLETSALGRAACPFPNRSPKNLIHSARPRAEVSK